MPRPANRVIYGCWCRGRGGIEQGAERREENGERLARIEDLGFPFCVLRALPSPTCYLPKLRHLEAAHLEGCMTKLLGNGVLFLFLFMSR